MSSHKLVQAQKGTKVYEGLQKSLSWKGTYIFLQAAFWNCYKSYIAVKKVLKHKKIEKQASWFMWFHKSLLRLSGEVTKKIAIGVFNDLCSWAH